MPSASRSVSSAGCSSWSWSAASCRASTSRSSPTWSSTSGIRDADFNWFEASQLLLSAIVVPFLAKLGDMVGHKRILLISTVLTAGATWWLAFTGDFTSFLIAWALQGFYVVWLPLEVALIFDRGRTTGKGASQTRRAAGYLVVALEAGAIIGALGGGRLFSALGQNVTLTLMAPAVAVTLVFFAILFGVPESKPLPGRKLDTMGFVILTLGLLLITSGLTFLKINIESPMWWVAIPIMLVGVLVFIPWGRYELRQPGPRHRPPRAAAAQHVARAAHRGPGRDQPARRAGAALDVRGHRSGERVRAGAGCELDLLHHRRVSGLDDHRRSAVPRLSKWTSPRVALIVATFFVAVGYLLFIPFHETVPTTFMNMAIAGLGSGALVGALPAAAAAAAPRGQTGIATGLTNTTKTIGGSFASAVFAIVLFLGAGQAVTATASSLGSYLIVFTICGVGALVAAVLLFLVPKLAFADTGGLRGAGADQCPRLVRSAARSGTAPHRSPTRCSSG